MVAFMGGCGFEVYFCTGKRQLMSTKGSYARCFGPVRTCRLSFGSSQGKPGRSELLLVMSRIAFFPL